MVILVMACRRGRRGWRTTGDGVGLGVGGWVDERMSEVLWVDGWQTEIIYQCYTTQPSHSTRAVRSNQLWNDPMNVWHYLYSVNEFTMGWRLGRQGKRGDRWGWWQPRTSFSSAHNSQDRFRVGPRCNIHISSRQKHSNVNEVLDVFSYRTFFLLVPGDATPILTTICYSDFD